VSRFFDENILHLVPWIEGSEKNPKIWFVNESTWHISGEYFSALLTTKLSTKLLYRPVFSVAEKLFVDGHQRYFCRCYTRTFQPVTELLLFQLIHIVLNIKVISWRNYGQIKFKDGGPGSSVGAATGYGLDGPEIEFRGGRDFPQLSRPALGPTQPPLQWVPGLSRGSKRPGRLQI
jgi:hypothetical protein